MPDCIKITHAQPMTTPTIRTALERLIQLDDTCCPHNVDAISGTSPWDDAIADIRAVLKAEPQAERPSEKDLYDLAAEFDGDPVPAMRRALELWGNPLQGDPAPAAPATPPAPVPRDVGELLTNNGVFKGAHGIEGLLSADAFWEQQPYGTRLYYGYGNADYLHRDVLRSAVTLLQRLASPAYLVADRLPEGVLDLLKSEPGEIQVCTAGVSIEPPKDAARPTFLDAIRLAEGCHDYSGGHCGTEGEAWHGAIDTVVAALKRAAIGPWDSQTRAVYGVGVEAGAGEVAERGPVAVRERLRIVMAGLGLGYMAGHNDTVESTYADPDEFAADYAPQVLGELDPLPAPQAGEVEEVDPDHANRLGTIIPSDIKQLADQLDRDGLRLIEVGYANESLPTRDTGLRVVRASYILQQQQAELATLKDDGWAKAMTDLVDQIGGEGPYLWEWGASIPTPKKVVEYLREHIDYLEHLGRVQGALTALKVDPVAESERPWEREGWCNEKGDFWAERINREGIAEWEQANRNHLGNWMVRCLPHNAIPLPPPQAGEVEA